MSLQLMRNTEIPDSDSMNVQKNGIHFCQRSQLNENTNRYVTKKHSQITIACKLTAITKYPSLHSMRITISTTVRIRKDKIRKTIINCRDRR